jgi:glycosyltransferase involved in cell wall biosynthesis
MRATVVQAQRTLRVGFLIDRWQPFRGGAERALAQLARHLEAQGHEVHAFAAHGPRPDEAAPGRVHLVRAGRFALTRGARERMFGQAGLAAARAQQCDVTVGVRHLTSVDLYWPHGGSHARSVAAWSEARAWRAGAVSVHEPAALTGRHRAFVAFERALLDRGGARAVACVSDLVERELAEDFPASRERLVRAPNGVDLERFHPRAGGAEVRRGLELDDGAPAIAFVARQPVLKGLPVLFAALARLQGTPWTLVVSGPRDVGVWERRARAAGIDPHRVRVVRGADSAALLAAADLCVLPTWRDTSGLVVLEALACGTPVITTARAGACDAIRPEAGTVLARPGDIETLTASLSTWIARVRENAVQREAVRACVADRGLGPWLSGLEALLVELCG